MIAKIRKKGNGSSAMKSNSNTASIRNKYFA